MLTLHTISEQATLTTSHPYKTLMILPLWNSLNAVFMNFNRQFEVVSMTESLAILDRTHYPFSLPQRGWGQIILTF